MATINIAETKYTDNPNDMGQKISNLEKFLDGFKQLCKVTHMNCVTTYKLGGIISFNFEDGSVIGSKIFLEKTGFN